MFCFRQLLLPVILCLGGAVSAQQLTLGKTPYLMNKSAVLELNADNQGLLLPRIADTTSINTLTPPDGMLIYFTPLKQLLLRANGYWQPLPVAASLKNYWTTAGNSGTTWSNNFLGTTDNTSLRFRTANTERMHVDSLGNVAIGSAPSFSAAPNLEKFLVDAGATSSYNLMTGRGSIDNYLQINIKNTSATASASSDIVASADNGDETSNFIDMGINSSAYTNTASPVLSGINTAYLYSTGRNFMIGNASSTTYKIGFFTGGTAAANERLTILGAGNVGIGVTNPSQKLEVGGAVRFSGALMPGGSTGTAGQILQSNGSSAPVWTSASASGSTAWAVDGNSVAAIRKFGTITAYDLPVITNNIERMRIAAGGNIGIGNTAPAEKLDITGNLRFSGALMPGGAAGTSGYVLTSAGAGSAPTWQDPATTITTYGWLQDGNTLTAIKNFGTLSNHALPFVTNNAERMRLSAAGNLGIGNIAPAEKLDVTGNVKFSGALMPGNDAGTAGYLLQSNGAGMAPLWLAPASSGAWALDGNAVSAVKKLGTTSNFNLPFITNNIERMRLDTSGYLGIGTNAPAALLHVAGINPLLLQGVQLGTNTIADSVLTINSGVVQKLPAGTFQARLNGSGFVKVSGTTITYDNNTYTIANAAITGATKTKITYDSKGLVTAGADATTSDIAEGSNQYFTQSRVLATPLTGFSASTATAVAATDNVLTGIGKLQGQINTINGAGYLTGNQTITFSGDVSGSGTTAITTTIGNNKVTLAQMAQVSSGSFLGRTTAATGNVEALTTAQVKTLLGLDGSNSGDVSLAGQSYLSLSGQTITANPVDLSSSHATGTLAAARFGALSGDVTNTAGSYATTIATGAVTYGKMQNVSATSRILGRASSGAGIVEELTIGSGLSLSGTTLSANGAGMWSTAGNASLSGSNFLGTTDDKALILKSNNTTFAEMGRRHTLGLVQNFTDYQDSSESVLHMKSAVQFYAPAAQFYKPKIYVDANGNFRTKGSSAATDFFEFGATGTNNDGGFEFISGDDGDEPIIFKSNHHINGTTEMMRLQSGRMAVGSNSFNSTNPEKLLIDAGTTTSYNLMTGKGSIDNYLQINVKNSSATANASSDIVASADNGDETVNFIDMGINSSAYSNTTYPVIGGVNNAYLYSTGNDFIIGNATTAKPLRFFTGGYAAANERLRIDGTGNVGIGTTAPAQKLDVSGAVKFSGALMPNGLAGNMGYVLTSSGAGVAPTWQDGTTYVTNNAWILGGNTLTTLRNFGTTSNYDLPIITNNTERMRIAADGKIGLGGTLSDAYSFVEVRRTLPNNTDSVLITLNSNNSGANGGGSLQYKNTGAGYMGAIAGVDDGGYNGRLEFRTNSAGGSARTTPLTTADTKMVLKDNGNLGIGLTTPAEKLDVSGNLRFSGALMPGGLAGTTGYLLQSNGAGTAPGWVSGSTLVGSSAWLQDGNSLSAIKKLGTTTNYALPFITNNVERMRLTTDGFLGLGTASPAGRLHAVSEGSETGDDYLFDDYTNSTNPGFFFRRSRGTAASPANLQSGDLINTLAFIPRVNGTMAYSPGSAMDAFYLGTGTDNKTDLRFTTSGTERLRINENGNVGIGATAFDATNPEELLVDAGTTTSYNLIKARGSINNYLQLNIQNSSSGTVASSDVVATANNGTESINYIDMGINSSGYTDATYPVLTGVNNAYLYSTGNDLVIGNATANKNLRFFTGGTATTNERMRIDGSGTVAINTTSPNTSAKLDVAGVLKLGAKGTLVNNIMAFEGTLSAAISMNDQETGDVTFTLPTANTLTSTRATVSVSPAADLPAGVTIAWARAISTTQIKVRFYNGSATSVQTIASGSKVYMSIVDY